MWIYLPDCHVSIVAHCDHADSVLVRARLRGDLERFLAGTDGPGITETPDADYRFRCVLQRETLGAILADLAASMDWTNVKGAIHPAQADRACWYSIAWRAGVNAQEDERERETCRA